MINILLIFVADNVGFISYSMVKGFTILEFMMVRFSVIKYVGKRDKFTCFLEFMVRYGMDFLIVIFLS